MQLKTIGELKRRMQQLRETRIAENEWQSATGKGIIFPVGPRKSWWDLFVLLLVVYTSIMDPFRFAFDVPAVGSALLFELFISIVFMCDFCLSWYTAFLNTEGYWIIDRKAIAHNYLRGWFWVDLPSSLPLELIPLLIHNDEGSAGVLKDLRILRIVRLARAVQLLKLDRKFIDFAEALHLNMRITNIFRLLAILMYMTHILAAGWRLLAGYEHDAGSPSWLSEYERAGGRGVSDPTPSDQYLTCFNFALSMLLVVGYQEMLPATNVELVFVILSMLVGVLAFGYVLNSVSSLLQTVDLLGAWKVEKQSEVKEYLRWRQLPAHLTKRVARFHERYIADDEAHFHNEEDVLSILPPALRREVYAYLFDTTAGIIPLLNKPSHEFRKRMHESLTPLLYEKDDVILGKGHDHSEMYFLSRGHVDACNAYDGRVVFPIADQGEFFGETAFVGALPAFTFVASTWLEVLYIASDKLALAAQELLAAPMRDAVAEGLQQELLHKGRYRAWMLRMLCSEFTQKKQTVHAAAVRIQHRYLNHRARRIKITPLEELMPLFYAPGKTSQRSLAPSKPSDARRDSSRRMRLGSADLSALAAISLSMRESAPDPSEASIASVPAGLSPRGGASPGEADMGAKIDQLASAQAEMRTQMEAAQAEMRTQMEAAQAEMRTQMATLIAQVSSTAGSAAAGERV